MTECKIKRKQSHIERTISSILIDNEIKYTPEQQISSIDRRRWDFFLPDLNIVIEGDGGQHFFENKKFRQNLEEEQKNDVEKTKIALSRGYKVIRLDFLLSSEEFGSRLLEAFKTDCELYVSDKNLYGYLLKEVKCKTSSPKEERKLDVEACNIVMTFIYKNEININYYFYKDKILTVYVETSSKQLITALVKLGFNPAKGFVYTNKILSSGCKWLVSMALGDDIYYVLENMKLTGMPVPKRPLV